MQELCRALGISGCTQLVANLNLVAQILMIAALWVGFYFARTKQIRKHRDVQTTVIISNIFLIAFVMITSFYLFVIAGGTTGGIVAQLMMIHGLLGLIAELLGIYLVLRMRTQLIPPRFRVRNFRLVMRSTLGLWTLIVVLGLGIYYFRYLTPRTPATALSETPTAAPPTSAPPTATSAPTATAAPPTAIPARGQLTFANDKALNDKATVRLANVPPPAAGKIYQAWFAASTVDLLTSLGEVKVNPDGTATIEYSAPFNGNLIALYDQFFITLESALATKPSATLIFSGQFAARLSGEVKALMGFAPDTPENVGYLIGLYNRRDDLSIHAAELRDALVRNNLPTMKRHAEHLINLLEGLKGKDFGDGDKNGRVEDPGDGYGMIPYVEQILQRAQGAANSPDATDSAKQRATELQVEATNVKQWADTILKDALAVLAAGSVQQAAAQIQEVNTLAQVAVKGQDKNGNGKIEPIADEAGMQQMFTTAQELAGLALTPIQVTLAQNLPTPTPTARPTATPTAAPRTVTVLMQDFAFKDKTLTIERGTTIVWLNKDPAKHTVTSDSGNPLDSKDVQVSRQFSFTFANAGTFAYYCEYHGDRGGVDMAGTIVVR